MSTTLHPSEADDVSGELSEHAEGADVLADDPVEAGVVVTQAGGALTVLRRGIKASPELRIGFRITVLMAVINAVGRIIIPVLIQQILDKGILTSGGFNAAFTLTACGFALLVTIGVTVLGRTTYIRLVTAAETTLRNLHVRAFAHIHSLSVADHNEAKRGVLTSRVTSDIETIARFAQWGAIAWIVNSVVIIGVLLVMAVYSWQLALLTVLVLCPLLPLMRVLQRKQLRAYDVQRTRVGETLSAVSESVMGAGVVRAYGIATRTTRQPRPGHRQPVPCRNQGRSLLRPHVSAGRHLRSDDAGGCPRGGRRRRPGLGHGRRQARGLSVLGEPHPRPRGRTG